MEKLLAGLAKNNGSDLHLKSDCKPVFRISTQLYEAGSRALSAGEIKKITYEVLCEEQKAHFERHQNLDFAYNIENIGRFRVNLFKERGNMRWTPGGSTTKSPALKS